MVRDYSAFFKGSGSMELTAHQPTVLQALGWGTFFAQQTDVGELANHPAARVVAVHRSGLRVVGDGIDETVPPRADATIGDWLMLDRAEPGAARVLERKSVIKRRAPGADWQVQLIAANIDTVFVVTSCNQDFNVARLERYAALAFEAEVEPVILLTKTDLVDDPQPWIDAAMEISDRIAVVALDARGGQPEAMLAQWCKPGRTVAFLGSSGVGKSTLTNALIGAAEISTQPIRQDDAKGRHTTTHRELHVIVGKCIVLDTPGMRELQLTDAAFGISNVFEDIEDLSAQCRFNDCQHETEPACAVQAAVREGLLDETRVTRWRKLKAEDAFNSSSIAQRRSTDRAFGKMVKGALKDKSKRKS